MLGEWDKEWRVTRLKIQKILFTMNALDENYKTLFLIFRQVLSFCQGDSDNADVKTMFESARVLEDACKELEKTGTSESFEAKLTEFWELTGIKCVPLKFFEKASYHILSRYIVDGRFNDAVVGKAVHQFIKDRSENDFHEFCQQLVNTNRTVEGLKKTLYSPEDLSNLIALHYLEELRKSLIRSHGDAEEVYSEIHKYISNDSAKFKIFLQILCVQSDCEMMLETQEVVALSLGSLLRDNGSMNLYQYFFHLSEEDFANIVTKWCHFCETFLQNLKNSVKRLKCDYSENAYSWSVTGSDPCLSFEQIVAFISRCKHLPGMSDKIKEFLCQIGDDGFRILAEDIMIKCKIS